MEGSSITSARLGGRLSQNADTPDPGGVSDKMLTLLMLGGRGVGKLGQGGTDRHSFMTKE